MRDEDDPDEPEVARRRESGSRLGRRLGEQILTGLLDPESALRRGQDLFSGLTQATKDEIMRLVGTEVRSFLRQIDAADLLRDVVQGLKMDVQIRVRFEKDEGGALVPRVESSPATKPGSDGKPEGSG